MKLEAVPSAAKAYQGSVLHAASVSGTVKAPKAVSVSSITNVSKAANMPRAVNVPDIAHQSNKTDAASVQTAADDGKIVKRETGSPDGNGKTVIYDESEKDILENTGTQQNSKQLLEAVDKLKEKMAANTEAVFGIHEGTNRVMIKIVDKETKDVIKEYPPEKTLDMIQKVWEMAGIMVDEKL